jgi:hypothetical protein
VVPRDPHEGEFMAKKKAKKKANKHHAKRLQKKKKMLRTKNLRK